MKGGKPLPRAEDVDVQGCRYTHTPLTAPIVTGWRLKLLLNFSETPLFTPIRKYLMRKSGLTPVLKGLQIPEEPMFVREPFSQRATEPCTEKIPAKTAAAERAAIIMQSFPEFSVVPLEVTNGKLRRATLKDYYHAYRTGQTTPLEVAERVIQFLRDGDKRPRPLSWFISWSEQDIRRQAKESTLRYREGKPLSAIDGVPFSVKDMMDALPYDTTVGSAFSAKRHQVVADTPCVANLRSAGAVVLGKSNCHEIGIGNTGLNAVYGTPVNPWNEGCLPGGSSGGAATSAAAGLCPIGTGTDTGGSTRTPIAWNGTVGLVTTNGRVSTEHSHPLNFTLTVFGPIAACMQDLIFMYGMMAESGGEGTGIPELVIPKNLDLLLAYPLSGLKMGIYWEWFNHADEEVVEASKKALAVLEALGVELVSVKIPELDLLHVAHQVTISSEMLSTFHKQLANRKERAKMQADTRSFMFASLFMNAADYIQCQRIRRRAAVHFKRVLDRVDFIVTPTAPMTAPEIWKGSMEFPGGTDLGLTGHIMRFMPAVNMLGLPALTLPVGKDSREMPIGMQMIGRHWQEATLLRSGYFLEAELNRRGLEVGNPPLLVNPLSPRPN